MVYEGRRRAGRRRVVKAAKGSGGFGRVCLWLLIFVVAAWAVFPGTMRKLRDKAALALGIDLDGAVRVFSEERDGGAGIFGAAKSSVMYAFGAGEDSREPASDSGDGEDLPAGATDGAELADLPLPKYVSAGTPQLDLALTRPVEGEVTAPFGYRRDGAGTVSFHYGCDVSASTGEAVRAMATGRVMAVGESTTYGKYVIISHEGGVETIYAHMGRTSAAGGETVEAGREIGFMGDEEGAYLHLELIVDGEYVDPEGYLK